ncbi:MAG: hypothetical protein WDN08_18180 [Rhizomicrobium sp.]
MTCGLLAVALGAIGVPARSWLGWQIPIRTSSVHGSARIEGMDGDLMNESLARGEGRGGRGLPGRRRARPHLDAGARRLRHLGGGGGGRG